MQRPMKLAHVILRTSDVQRMADWYCSVFDARPTTFHPPQLIFITFDEEHHRLGFVHMGREATDDALKAPGLAHIAFTYASARDLLRQYSELKDAGVTPAFTIHHGPTLSAYYRDPDGNVIEMFAEVFETMDAANEFMKTPLFVNNPVGKAADFDQLALRARQGASEQELLAYPPEDIDHWALAEVMTAALEGRA